MWVQSKRNEPVKSSTSLPIMAQYKFGALIAKQEGDFRICGEEVRGSVTFMLLNRSRDTVSTVPTLREIC